MRSGIEVEGVLAALEAQAFDDFDGAVAIAKGDGGGSDGRGGQGRLGTNRDNDPQGQPAGAGWQRGEFHHVVGLSGGL